MFRALLILAMTFVCFAAHGKRKDLTLSNTELESYYREAQREFHKNNFSQAQVLFTEYLDRTKKGLNKKERLFWVIDQIGYIYLKVKSDPDGAITFFKKFESDSRLSEAEQDTISEWIGVSKDWKKEKEFPQKIQGANKLYSLGKKYFDRGIKKKSYPMDDKGNADLAISEAYLRPFIIRYDDDPRIGDVLVMMGRIKYNLRTDADYWSENFYLKEAIRRYPGTKLAQSAWKKLNDDIHIGYSGSSGDNTPPSILQMLEMYKKIAFMKTPMPNRKR